LSYTNGKRNLFDQGSGTTHEWLVNITNIRYINVHNNLINVCVHAQQVYYHSLFRWAGLKRDCRFIIFSSIHWVSTESSLEWKSFKQKKNTILYTHTHGVRYVLLYTARAAKICRAPISYTCMYRKSSEIRSDFVNFATALIHRHTHTAIYNVYLSSSLLAIHCT